MPQTAGVSMVKLGGELPWAPAFAGVDDRAGRHGFGAFRRNAGAVG